MLHPTRSIALTLLLVGSAGAQVYNAAPDWISANPGYSTGAAMVDIDRDGLLDLVVADGNDITPGPIQVWYNQGGGVFNEVADWTTPTNAYHGHLDVADVNGDGWPDIAVTLLLNQGGPAVKVHLNNAGTLSNTPDWVSDQEMPAFGCSFGDVNGDGRPDLAIATGFAYDTPNQFHNYVFINQNGTLETNASWMSDDSNDLQGCLFADADDDGHLDLIGIAARSETRVYRNLGGTLETTASWTTSDSVNQDGIMVAVGDVTGDGVLDLFATDNTQLGGNGRFKQYTGLADGLFESTYTWSYYDGYGSAVALADVNGDDLLDLATGAWWDRTRIFLNNGSGFDGTYDWASHLTSVVEKIVFGDVNPACDQELVFTETFPTDGDRSLFRLPHQPVQNLRSVVRDGVVLGPDEYTWHREYGWISLDGPPTVTLEVTYGYSHSLDMLVSNWDSNKGNYLRYNLGEDDCNENGVPDGCDIADGTSTDFNGNGIPDECEAAVPGDLDGDGDVDLADLGILLASYGSDAGGDLDGDGDTDLADLGILLANYGFGT